MSISFQTSRDFPDTIEIFILIVEVVNWSFYNSNNNTKNKARINNDTVIFWLLLHKGQGYTYLRLLTFKQKQVISNGWLI